MDSGGEKYTWAEIGYDIFFYQYEKHSIWGMTANIVRSVVKLIEEYNLCP